MLDFIKDVIRIYRFGPRVKDSLKLVAGPSGEAEEAVVDSDAMSNDRVVLWDGTFGDTGRFKTIGVTAAELEYLDSAVKGTAVANKVVVLDNNKSVSGINVLSASNLVASVKVSAPTLEATSVLTSSGTLVVAGNVSLDGKVIQNIKLENTKRYQLYYGSSPRDMIRRASASSITVYIGNSSDRLYFDTAAYHLYHRRAGINYKIWTQQNDGSGSGLDADTLDGVQYSAINTRIANLELVTTYQDGSIINTGWISSANFMCKGKRVGNMVFITGYVEVNSGQGQSIGTGMFRIPAGVGVPSGKQWFASSDADFDENNEWYIDAGSNIVRVNALQSTDSRGVFNFSFPIV